MSSGASTSPGPPKLRVYYPPGKERHLLVEKDTFTIGRRPDNDLVVAEKDISRLQAVIVREAGAWYLEDRGSTFGTDVNGTPATRHRLRNRDVISMGRQREIEMIYLHEDRMSRILEEVDNHAPRDTTPDEHRNLLILLELTKRLNTMTSLQDMLELALDAVLEVTGAERGFLMLRDEQGEMAVRAVRNPSREQDAAGAHQLSRSIVREVVATGEPRFVEDARQNSDVARRASIEELSLRALVCLPLKILPAEQVTRPVSFPGGSDVMGVIYADSARAAGPSSRITRDLIVSIALQATFALENFFLRQEDLERRLTELEMEREMERLQALDRLKTEFLGNVSHELRTPLTAIKGAVDNILDGVTGAVPDRQRHYLTRINENADQLNRLIGDLLDLARIETGRVDLRPASTSVARLLEDAAESMRPLAERRGIQLQVEPPRDDVVLLADRDRLMQVLFNLVGNALKFTGSGGRVTVSAQSEAGGVRICVADTGAGIPEGELERIFDRFYQVRPAQGAKFAGAGLGLPIARSLVELHGGRLWAEPALEGSRFLLTLPLESPPGGAAAAVP